MKNRNWYHGSSQKINLFNPFSFDLGNTFQKPGWGTFCFKNYEYTKKFTIMRLIQNFYSEIKNEQNKKFLHINRCTWDFVNEKIITTKDGFQFIKENIIGKKVYIHTIDSACLKKKGIGNDITHKEYTFRDENVKPINIETIVIEENLLKDSILIVNDVNCYREECVHISSYYNRGFLSLFITYDYTINRDEIEKIIVAISNRSLAVGEDLSKFIKDNHVNIKKIPIRIRLKQAICGSINRVFFRKKIILRLRKFDENIMEEL